LQEPIVLLDGAILDGRNRYNACLAAGVEPAFVPFRGEDALKFVLAANLHRRHLNESQRSMIAAKLATLRDGVRQDRQGASIDAPTQSQAAEMLSVSRPSVQRARQVLEHAGPTDIVAITNGNATVSGVAKKLRGKKSDDGGGNRPGASKTAGSRTPKATSAEARLARRIDREVREILNRLDDPELSSAAYDTLTKAGRLLEALKHELSRLPSNIQEQIESGLKGFYGEAKIGSG
jgi:ParB-like chromosome segregation protein Spo0J